MANRVANSTMPQQSSNSSTGGVPHDHIAKRAYEKWCKRGRTHGNDRQDWIDAETELRAEANRTGQTGSQSSQTVQGNQASRTSTPSTMRR